MTATDHHLRAVHQGIWASSGTGTRTGAPTERPGPVRRSGVGGTGTSQAVDGMSGTVSSRLRSTMRRAAGEHR